MLRLPLQTSAVVWSLVMIAKMKPQMVSQLGSWYMTPMKGKILRLRCHPLCRQWLVEILRHLYATPGFNISIYIYTLYIVVISCTYYMYFYTVLLLYFYSMFALLQVVRSNENKLLNILISNDNPSANSSQIPPAHGFHLVFLTLVKGLLCLSELWHSVIFNTQSATTITNIIWARWLCVLHVYVCCINMCSPFPTFKKHFNWEFLSSFGK